MTGVINQNPGIGGLEELTDLEELWVQTGLAGVVELNHTTAPSNTSLIGKIYVKSSDGNLYFLDESGSEFQITGGGSPGDVAGPASATDNAVARFDGTGGKTIQNSVVIIADTTGNTTGMGTLNTHTIPGGTSTFAILTNKLSDFAATTSAELAGVISDETGSGLLVFGTSPTLVTPALGTPSALVGTNITGTGASFTAGSTNALESATTTVNVSSATAPSSGQVLTATASTTATWQTPSGGTPTLADISTNSTDTAKSLYTMTSAVDVEYETSALATLLYLDEANARVGIGTNIPGASLDVDGGTSILGSSVAGVFTFTATGGTSTLNGGRSLALQRNSQTHITLNNGFTTFIRDTTFSLDVSLISDTGKLQLGAGDDASIIYDGTNMVFDSQQVGSGDFIFNGGNLGIGTTTADTKLHVEQDSAATATVTNVARLTSTSTGTPANGIGVGMEFEVETAAANNEIGAIIEAVATDVTAASEDFDIVFKNMTAGAAATETVRIKATGGLEISQTTTNDGLFINNTGGGTTVQLTEVTDVASGVQMELFHDSTSPAIQDELGQIKFSGNDSAANKTIYSSITGGILDPTSTSEDGVIIFRTFFDGTSDTRLLVGGLDAITPLNGIGVGSDNAAGIISSVGDFDLILQTGNSTSGTFTITDGANGDITINPDGTGEVNIAADLELNGNNIDNGGVIFLNEQAEADGDVAGSGQLWVDTATPNKFMFTDDAGTDFIMNDVSDNLKFIDFVIVDPATDVATGTGLFTWSAPFAGTIIQDDSNLDFFAAYTTVAGTTGTMVVDIHKGGTTIMTTNKLDIETTELDTTTAATQPDLTTTTFVAGDVFTVDVDAVHTTAAKGLLVRMTVRPN